MKQSDRKLITLGRKNCICDNFQDVEVCNYCEGFIKQYGRTEFDRLIKLANNIK